MSHVDFLAALLVFGIVARGLDLSWKNSKKKELRLELTSLNINSKKFLWDIYLILFSALLMLNQMSENNGA